MKDFEKKFGAESEGRLAPAKIDKPNFAEIMLFAACSDLFSVAYSMTMRMIWPFVLGA